MRLHRSLLIDFGIEVESQSEQGRSYGAIFLFLGGFLYTGYSYGI